MPPPRTPDGLPDLDAAAAGATDTSTAKTDIWDLGDLAKRVLVVSRGSKGRGTGTASNKLDPYDREYAESGSGPSSASAADLIKQPISLYSSDPAAYLALQRALYAGGFFGSTDAKNIPWGQYTDATLAAWRRVLTATAQAQDAGQSLTPEDILRRGVEGYQAVGEEPKKKPALVIDYTDPEAVASTLQQAAQNSLGRNLSDDEIKHFVSEFRAAESAYQTKVYNAQTSEKSGVRVEADRPSLEAQAQQEVKEGRGTEIAANDMADYVRVIEQLLG